MPKQFPLEIVIAATDKASAAIKRITDRVDRINEPFARLSKNLGKLSDASGLSRVGSALSAVGSAAVDTAKRITLGFVAATTAVGLFTYRTAMAADTIGDTAKRLNVSTDALQAWTYGFDQADVGPEALTASLDTLNKQFGLAKIGMGKGLPILRGLGIDPKRVKTLDELLPLLADRLSKISDPAKRSAIATKLLGDAGSQMAIKLAEGPKALAEMVQAAKAAGAIIDPDTIEKAGKFDEVMKSLRATFKGVAGNAMGQLYPTLIKIAEAIQQAIIKYQPQINAFAQQFADKLPAALDKTFEAFGQISTAVSPLIDLVGKLFEIFGVGNTILGAFVLLVGAQLIGALFSLGLALAGLGVSLTVAFAVPALIIAGIAALIALGWTLYKNWDNVTKNLKTLWSNAGKELSEYWEAMKSGAVAAFDWIYSKLQNHPLFLLFRAQKWALGMAGIGGGAPVGSAAPIGVGVLPAPQKQQVEVKVDLSNLPTGTRTEVQGSGGIDWQLSRGFAMPGAN